MVFLGATFCAHCGVRVGEIPGAVADGNKRCPQCREPLRRTFLGSVAIAACAGCDGLWLDTETFKSICADRERQSLVIAGVGVPELKARFNPMLDPVRYRPCPVCTGLMNRVNFGGRSGVIIDSCRDHGTWFDRDELRRIVEFIRSGGMDWVRQDEIARLKEARRNVSMPVPTDVSTSYGGYLGPVSGNGLGDVVAWIAVVIIEFLLD